MYKYNFILSLLLVSGLLIGAASCEDFVERYPKHAISQDVALETIEGIESTIAGLYNRLQGEWMNRNMNLAGAMLADDMQIAATNSNRMVNHPRNVEGAHFGIWSGRYNDINRINMVLRSIDDTDGSQEQIAKFKGEIYAMRGYLYFKLLKVYARPYLHQEPLVQGEPLGVIIKTQPFVGIDESSFQARATIEEGYQLVLDDLETALDYLEGVPNREYPYYFTDIAVKAIMARLHLFMGNWQEAINYAEDVISEAPNDLVNAFDRSTYLPVFANAPGSESILELKYSQDDRPGMGSSITGMASYGRPESGVGYGDAILRQDLVNQLDEYGALGHPAGEMYYEALKGGLQIFLQDKYSSYRGQNYWDDIKLIRMPEMYFIAAEAYAELNELDDAKMMLQIYRDHRGIGHLEIDADNKEDFIEILFADKRVEYFAEMSHRWFDHVRRGMDIPKGIPGVDDGADAGPISFTDYRVVGRIPISSEIATNPNCLQNPGY